MILRIGTRGSKLALAQSEWVRRHIEARHPNVKVELVRIKTKGDKILDAPLSKIGGKGLFVKEIEDALLRHEVDLAVHSMKDVPAVLPEGLKIAVYPVREDPHDALVSLNARDLAGLNKGARIGTGSLRRSAQLLHRRSDVQVVPIRGNVDTRLKKLETGEVDAVILAMAGLRRLGLANQICTIIPMEEFLPAIGQGALGLELREGDEESERLLAFLNHEETSLAVKAERALLKELEGGCQVPIAAHAVVKGEGLFLEGMVAELDGSMVVREKISGGRDAPEALGTALGERLLALGAKKILDRIYGRE